MMLTCYFKCSVTGLPVTLSFACGCHVATTVAGVEDWFREQANMQVGWKQHSYV